MELGNVKVLTRKTSNVNMQTGEVIEKEESVLLQTKKRERFMLLYVENFSAVVELSRRAQMILAHILAKKVAYGTNEVFLNSVFRAELAEEFKTSKQSIANSISELIQKRILKRERKSVGYLFFLNPYLFGQGEWNVIEKQRQQFTIDYDFQNYTASKEVKTISAYKGMPSKEDIQIVKRERYTDETGVEKHNVYIDTKDEEGIVADIEEIEINNASNTALPTNIEEIEINNASNTALPTNIEEIEINDASNTALPTNIETIQQELNIKELELKNREKELNIKELEAKNREKELNIKELELKLKLEELALKKSENQ